MPTFLRAIYAGPRKLHPTTGLDLCYVSRDPTIICLSRPVTAYPHVLFCNPLSELLDFILTHHPPSDTNPIRVYNLRGEFPGYHDHELLHLPNYTPAKTITEALSDDAHSDDTATSPSASSSGITVHHAPWPDHHPPPLCLLLATIANMDEFISSNTPLQQSGTEARDTHPQAHSPADEPETQEITSKNNTPVVLVHCKAGKGRSGTLITSYLIAYQGYTYSQALRAFTDARMKSGMGQGVSIRSQCRYVQYISDFFSNKSISKLRPQPSAFDRKVRVKKITLFGVARGGVVAVEVAGYGFDTSDVRGIWAIKTLWTKGVELYDVNSGSCVKVVDVNVDGGGGGGGGVGGGGVLLETPDVKVGFVHSLCYGTVNLSSTRVWFNAVAEAWKSMPDGGGGEPVTSGVFSATWEEADGVKGTSWKGKQAYERVEVEWEIVSGDGGDGGGACGLPAKEGRESLPK